MEFQRLVEEFMRTSGQIVYTKVRQMTTDQAKLRYELFQEEVKELDDAYKTRDRVGILDALVDAVYILIGTAATKGINIEKYVNAEVNSLRVAENFEVFGVPLTTIKIRRYIKESLEELKGHGVDELMPSLVVIFRIARLLGISTGTYREAFKRVHASNMTKFCTDSITVSETLKHYDAKGVSTYVGEVGGYIVVYRYPDGKVLKSIDYEPVNLVDLVGGVG